jgi:hypothetical protein
LGLLCRRAERQVFAGIAEQLPPAFRKEIDQMLEVPESAHRSSLFHLKAYPPEGKPDTILSFLDNYQYLRSIGVAEIRLAGCSLALLLQFSKTARREDVWHLRRMPEAKRHALTACFLVEALKITLDHAVEMTINFSGACAGAPRTPSKGNNRNTVSAPAMAASSYCAAWRSWSRETGNPSKCIFIYMRRFPNWSCARLWPTAANQTDWKCTAMPTNSTPV